MPAVRYNASRYAIHYLFAIASLSLPAPELPSTYESVSLLRRDSIIIEPEVLRILPLGDSITYGIFSSGGNGYRLPLYDLLHVENELDYIGRVKSGTMIDNDHEGHPGYRIGNITDLVTSEYPDQPNLVLLMAGTNDVIHNHNLSTSSAALDKLIDKVVNTYPNAAVLVAEITPFLNPKREEKRLEFNSAIPSVVQKYVDDRKRVAVVDMGRVMPQHINTTDEMHPIDEGYRLIAGAYYDAILAAKNKGWLGGTMISFPNHSAFGEWISDPTWTPLRIITYGLMAVVVVSAVRKLIIIAIRKYGTRLSI